MEDIISLCKRRGFIYPGSEIYDGFANSYTYGPYGTQLKNNIKNLWWRTFVESQEDMVGIDGSILLHPKTWEVSQHLSHFSDPLIDCKNCKARHRADHLVETKTKESADGMSIEELTKAIEQHKITCPSCGKIDFTPVRHFNMMFPVSMGKTDDASNITYLRPETAQAIFLEYKNIVDTMRVKVPFGIGQIGKSFRNEITPGNFIFRTLEFEQMEIEYFIDPQDWEKIFETWLQKIRNWCELIGLDKKKIYELEVSEDSRAHYSKRTVDFEYQFPFGKKELYGCAYRTDFDLTNHQNASGKKMQWTDPHTEKTFIPHVIEPSFGLERTILALLSEAYHEESLSDGSKRVVLKFLPHLSPVKVAIFPLVKKDGLPEEAKKIFHALQPLGNNEYDESGAIGKRYRRQDEIGTPVCITIDYETLENQTVTIRDRDTMEQERISTENILSYLKEKYQFEKF